MEVTYSRYGTTARPRWKSLTVRVKGGFLREGDQIVMVFGDTSQGSAGLRLQSMVEPNFEFKVAADVCAVGHYMPIPNTPNIAIVPGSAANWRAVLPSLRRPGDTFQLGIKAEDVWGNPTDLAQGSFTVDSTLPVNNLPAQIDYPLGQRSMSLENLSVDEPGILRITLRDDAGAVVAESHPLVVEDGALCRLLGRYAWPKRREHRHRYVPRLFSSSAATWRSWTRSAIRPTTSRSIATPSGPTPE